ncbi:MAG: prepilin-type N-terminal cleavage/methylation domain-containing protein [Coriobacteriales bacterium]|jgi:prepilin-type N-terminal cleavage/methylation domain-containing protein|nr:prepilin-type N-terminal cleavage/methylation domain-containing protein [Coriobacteriales bacterium]
MNITESVNRQKRRQAGFTLVEIIVVLLIIAILMAVAVPALTGYIDKAKDVEWEMKSRDVKIAINTVLTEAYAYGELEKNHSPHSHYDGYIDTGAPIGNLREWNLENVSIYLTGSQRGLFQQIAALTGEKEVGDVSGFAAQPGYTSYFIVGPQDSTILTADAFYYRFSPDGVTGKAGKPCIYVTYKLNRLNLADGAKMGKFRDELGKPGAYNPNAGYEVYHLIVS